MSDFTVLKNVRVAYANRLTTPDAQKNDDGTTGIAKYSCTFLLDTNTKEGAAEFESLKRAVVAAAKEKWPETWKNILQSLKTQARLGYNEGPHLTKSGEIRDGWEEGIVSVSAYRYADRGLPGLFDADLSSLGEDPSGVIYSGCVVNGKIKVWAWDHKTYGKRIRVDLLAVQFVKDGEAFAAAAPATAEGFEAVAVTGRARSETSFDEMTDDDIPF